MKDFLIKWFMKLNTLIIRLTRGRLGSRLGTQNILILHTIGRTSGQERAVPIAYFDYKGRYLVVASNWARDKNPDWYLNLKRNPNAKLEIKGQLISVTAREAQGEEYQRLWEFVTKRNAPYLDYQRTVTRQIAIMVFERGS